VIVRVCVSLRLTFHGMELIGIGSDVFTSNHSAWFVLTGNWWTRR